MEDRYLTDEEIIARGLGIRFTAVDPQGEEKSWVQLTFDYIAEMEGDGPAEDIRN